MIQVFNADGTRMEDAYSLSGSYSGGWHLLCPVSLELRVGRVLSQWTAPDQSWRIMTIDGSEDAALSLEGEIIWTLAEARQQGREQADLLSGVDLRVETLRENATRTNVPISARRLRATLGQDSETGGRLDDQQSHRFDRSHPRASGARNPVHSGTGREW